MTAHEPRMLALGWADFQGQDSTLESHTILGRSPVKVQSIAHDAVVAFEQALIETDYENPCDWIGSYNNRKIAGRDMWSTHSYGTAIDHDYGGGDSGPHIDNNPHLHRPIVLSDYGNTIQLMPENIAAIEAIKNVEGKPIWLWLGHNLGDSMHFQINVAPDKLKLAAGDPTCPWGFWCERHYTPDTDKVLGNGDGEHQGQCNVPPGHEPEVDWAFDIRRFRAGNKYRYDYETLLTEGRENAFEYRAR